MTVWKPWQKVIGWLRQLLNAGNQAGLWPSQGQGPLTNGRYEKPYDPSKRG